MWKQKWFGLDNEAYDHFYLVGKFKKSAIKLKMQKKNKKKKIYWQDNKEKCYIVWHHKSFVQNVRSLSKHADVYVYMYMYIYVCMYIYKYKYIYIYIYI